MLTHPKAAVTRGSACSRAAAAAACWPFRPCRRPRPAAAPFPRADVWQRAQRSSQRISRSRGERFIRRSGKDSLTSFRRCLSIVTVTEPAAAAGLDLPCRAPSSVTVTPFPFRAGMLSPSCAVHSGPGSRRWSSHPVVISEVRGSSCGHSRDRQILLLRPPTPTPSHLTRTSQAPRGWQGLLRSAEATTIATESPIIHRQAVRDGQPALLVHAAMKREQGPGAKTKDSN
jgi:hypothetical protein